MHAAEELGASLVALELLLSTALFAVDVFIKLRRASGPMSGLIFSFISVVLFFIAFADKLPGHPTGLRGALVGFPGIHSASENFRSSALVLLFLLLLITLRLGIYTRLFIIPAFTLPEGEYHARSQEASRANDLSAPPLAYISFSLVFTALIAGIYAWQSIGGIFLVILLILAYLTFPFLWNLQKLFLLCIVQARIFALYCWLFASAIVISIVVLLGRMELWRMRHPYGEDLFFDDLKRRMRSADQRIRARIEREQEQLRDLAADSEEEED
jgi:hypothetical protein